MLNKQRSIAAGVAALCLGLLIVSEESLSWPSAAETSSLDASPRSSEGLRSGETRGQSLAQLSWKRVKVGQLPGVKQRAHWVFLLQAFLGVVLFVSAMVAVAGSPASIEHALNPSLREMGNTRLLSSTHSFRADTPKQGMDHMPSLSSRVPKNMAESALQAQNKGATESSRRTFRMPSLSAELAGHVSECVFKPCRGFGSRGILDRDEASRRTVAALRLRTQRNHMNRAVESEDGGLDNDKDAAKIQTMLADGEVHVRIQDFDHGGRSFREAAETAEQWVRDLKRDGSAQNLVEDALGVLCDVRIKLGAFYLARGHARRARRVLLEAVSSVEGRQDSQAWKARLLAANALRQIGSLNEAFEEQNHLLGDMQTVSQTQEGPEAAIAQVRGELSRTWLLQGNVIEATSLLIDTIDHLHKSDPGRSDRELFAHLLGWLGIAQLVGGHPQDALTAFNECLADHGENLPSGLAAATPDIQEVIQARARAKFLVGDRPGAQEDLKVVSILQEELWLKIKKKTKSSISSNVHLHPDPLLRGAMARTRLLGAEIALSQQSQKASTFANNALHMLREIEASGNEVPTGTGIASLGEAQSILSMAEGQQISQAKPSGRPVWDNADLPEWALPGMEERLKKLDLETPPTVGTIRAASNVEAEGRGQE